MLCIHKDFLYDENEVIPVIMNPGMLLFGLVDSGIAFFLVYSIAKAKFGGNEKMLARIIGASLGTIVFAVYFGIIVWFNTVPNAASQAAKNLVYAAPIVLTLLMGALVLLSQPPKQQKEAEENLPEEPEAETEEAEQS